MCPIPKRTSVCVATKGTCSSFSKSQPGEQRPSQGPLAASSPQQQHTPVEFPSGPFPSKLSLIRLRAPRRKREGSFWIQGVRMEWDKRPPVCKYSTYTHRAQDNLFCAASERYEQMHVCSTYLPTNLHSPFGSFCIWGWDKITHTHNHNPEKGLFKDSAENEKRNEEQAASSLVARGEHLHVYNIFLFLFFLPQPHRTLGNPLPLSPLRKAIAPACLARPLETGPWRYFGVATGSRSSRTKTRGSQSSNVSLCPNHHRRRRRRPFHDSSSVQF